MVFYDICVCTKKILVEFEDDTVPVNFVSGGDVGCDCKAATEAAATALDVPCTELILKMQSEEWGGRWVNVHKDDVIPDKAILQAVLRKSAKVWCIALCFCTSLTIPSTLQKSPETGTNTTTVAARASTHLTVSSSGVSAASSSSSHNPIQMRLCFSQDEVGLRKPNDDVCELFDLDH